MPFGYNPLSDATIHIYRSTSDIDRKHPHIGILRAVRTEPDLKSAACYLRPPVNLLIEVDIDSTSNVVCRVNGKVTENYTIKYKGRKQKRVWATY